MQEDKRRQLVGRSTMQTLFLPAIRDKSESTLIRQSIIGDPNINSEANRADLLLC
jgi:hypothetical protein